MDGRMSGFFLCPTVCFTITLRFQQWIAECEKIGGCHYDFTAYHYYGTDVQDLIAEVKVGAPISACASAADLVDDARAVR